jgi:integrase
LLENPSLWPSYHGNKLTSKSNGCLTYSLRWRNSFSLATADRAKIDKKTIAGVFIKVARRRGEIIKKNDDTYLVRIFTGRDADNKRTYFSETIKGKKKDADAFLTEKLSSLDKGEAIKDAKMPLNEHLDEWMNKVKRLEVSSRTFEGYKSLLKNHVRNGLGKRRLCDIKGFAAQELYTSMLDAGYSPKTIRDVHNLLNPAFKTAIAWSRITKNPCEACKLPKKKKTKAAYFRPEEIQAFLDAAKEDRFFAALLLAIETGMRPEEYLALRWDDINLEQSFLMVQQVVIGTKGGGYEFDKPKTDLSRRRIPLSKTSIAALKVHRRNQLKARMKINDVYQDLDLVFASVIGTPMQHQNFERRHFKKTIERANKKIRKENETRSEPAHEIRYLNLYSLRHTMATLLLTAGVNAKIVSERLGHASIVLTLDTYSHVLPTMQDDATNKLEELMFGVRR